MAGAVLLLGTANRRTWAGRLEAGAVALLAAAVVALHAPHALRAGRH